MTGSLPRIAVLGAGANGASIGADLVRAGHDVTLVEQWPAHVEAMRRDGGAMLLGAGTALVYPALLAAVGDVAHPAWRARAVGVYRLWRDSGFAVGVLLAGVLADMFGVRAAVWAVALLTAASGVVVAVRMYETLHRPSPPTDRSCP